MHCVQASERSRSKNDVGNLRNTSPCADQNRIAIRQEPAFTQISETGSIQPQVLSAEGLVLVREVHFR